MAQKPKHTPGPWTIGYDRDDGRPLEIVTEADTDRRVAFLASNGNAADAHLIEAAPELLAALKAMVAKFDKFSRCGSPFARAANETRIAARAAIVKAETV